MDEYTFDIVVPKANMPFLEALLDDAIIDSYYIAQASPNTMLVQFHDNFDEIELILDKVLLLCETL